MLIEAVLFVVFITLVLYFNGRRPKSLPPGPVPFPIVGNLFQMASKSKDNYVAFDKLAEEYGDVFSLRLGSTDIVVMTSYEAIKDTMTKDAWSGRPWSEYWAKRYMNQRIGMILLEGEPWKEQRRFALRHLRDFGFGKQNKMEEVIHEELNELTSRMRQLMADGKQSVMYISTFFNVSVLNVLWTMMSGVRYSHDDEKLKSLIVNTDELFKSQKTANPAMIFPILGKLFPVYFENTKQLAIYNSLHEYFKAAIKQHRNDASFGSSAHFIDVFLQEVDKSNKHESFTDDQLVGLCADFFVAGNETTSNTLSYAILYMIVHPEIQQKVYEEITSLVSPNERISLDHRAKMPYTEAVIMEVQRSSSIAPLAPPHMALEDTTYRGYKFRKGTFVFLNLYSINNSKKYWGDPEAFRPERFLNDEGLLIKHEHLIPFGLGKRVCPGESLAKMSLFLFFTTLIKKFKFETVPGHLDPSTKPIPGMTLSPQPYSVTVTCR